jgi:hypothetical protein
MAAHSALAEAPHDAPTNTRQTVQSVAELIAATLCGLHRVNDHFVYMNATLGDDGYIDVEVTRVYFDGENAAVRVLLHPTGPVLVTPHSVAKIGSGSRSVA